MKKEKKKKKSWKKLVVDAEPDLGLGRGFPDGAVICSRTRRASEYKRSFSATPHTQREEYRLPNKETTTTATRVPGQAREEETNKTTVTLIPYLCGRHRSFLSFFSFFSRPPGYANATQDQLPDWTDGAQVDALSDPVWQSHQTPRFQTTFTLTRIYGQTSSTFFPASNSSIRLYFCYGRNGRKLLGLNHAGHGWFTAARE